MFISVLRSWVKMKLGKCVVKSGLVLIILVLLRNSLFLCVRSFGSSSNREHSLEISQTFNNCASDLSNQDLISDFSFVD